MNAIDTEITKQKYNVSCCSFGVSGRKLTVGESVTIVFFGGSITWGGNATDIDQGSYRARTTQWFRQQYPQSRITSINAGIGGTGSDLGVFRCQSDVLVHQPDLVFVEFAVNDGGMEDEKSMQTFEGVLRQLLLAPSHPDVCVVYTIRKSDMAAWHAGQLSARAQTQQRLVEYYDLPSVSMAKGIADAVCCQQATWEELMNDDVHPLDAGHALYTQVLTESLASLFDQKSTNPAALPKPLVSDRYVSSTMQALPRNVSGWTWIDLENKGGWECFDGLLMADKPGTELTLTFNGQLVGLYYQLGPDTGNLHYRIDDDPEQLLEPFDKYAAKCTRPQYRILDDKLPDGPHTITLRIAQTKDEQSKGTWTRLAMLMIG